MKTPFFHSRSRLSSARTNVVGVITGFVLLGLTFAMSQTVDLPFSSGSSSEDGDLMLRAPLLVRDGHAMAYDAARNQTVTYSGSGNSGYLSETATWDGKNWTPVSTATQPTARRDFGMAYDSVRERVVTYGGNTGSSINQTAEWDGTDWTIRSPANNPGNRTQHAMVYDAARQRVLMYGGQNLNTNNGQTWEWDGTNWVNKAPSTAPSARRSPAMAYDAARQRVVLFGGNTGAGTPTPNGQTWEWDGSNWSQKTPPVAPSARYGHAMAYDAERQRVVLFGGSAGNDETWEWDGANWELKLPASSPPGRTGHAMTYDSVRKRVLLFGGTTGVRQHDTWEWDGNEWVMAHGGAVHQFDMRGKPQGVWRFGAIQIDSGVTVTFKPNEMSTPVVWLAEHSVVINGNLNLNGEAGKVGSVLAINRARGGPGGFGGGMGGARQDVSGSFAGTPGVGLGGGLPGVDSEQNGENATHQGSYGNVYLMPIMGGSGGGGGGSSEINDGPNGGGGGGAILIASSRDLTLNGSITAKGGARQTRTKDVGGTQTAGHGSGGAVVLVADRLLGTGIVDVRGGDNSSVSSNAGRIRLEGYERPFAMNSQLSLFPAAVQSPPVLQRFEAGVGGASLTIKQVAGQAVANVLSGSFSVPDVIFQEPGEVEIHISATGIPDGVSIGGRITVEDQVISLPAEGDPASVLTGGTTILRAQVPAGLGTIQAFTKNFVP
jgi:hypothetical protein